MSTPHNVKIKVNKLDTDTENIAREGFRHIIRDSLCPVPFRPTSDQIKIYHEKYKDLYDHLRR